MLPTASGAFHALPTCVEELDFDVLVDAGDFKVHEDVKDGVDEEAISQLLPGSVVEWQELLESIQQHTSTSPGGEVLVFDGAKLWSHGQPHAPQHRDHAVIPLSVQQQQLDNIGSQAIGQLDWIHDEVQLQLSALLAAGTEDNTPTPPPPPPSAAASAAAVSGPGRRSSSVSDQTVPFKRHDSTCSMTSSCSSDVKTERTVCVSSTPPPLRLHPSWQHGYSSKRGRPSSYDVSMTYVHVFKIRGCLSGCCLSEL